MNNILFFFKGKEIVKCSVISNCGTTDVGIKVQQAPCLLKG